MNATTLEQLAANSEIEFRRSRMTTQITNAKNRVADLEKSVETTTTTIKTLREMAHLSERIDPTLQSRGTRFTTGGLLVKETVLDLMVHAIEVSEHRLRKFTDDLQRQRDLLANLEPSLEKFEAELQS